MTNPYFDFPAYGSRFTPGVLARAEDINAVFDLASVGFDGVTTALALKAPLASPTFTGTVTFSGSAVASGASSFTLPSPGAVTDDSSKGATTAWVHDLVGSLSVGLPSQTGYNTTLRTNGTTASWGYLDHLHVRESQSSGADGGASSATTTHARTLNTVVENTIAGASLASNKVTLPAGTYKVRAHAPGYACGNQRLTLYNVTASAALLVGPNGQASVSGSASAAATLSGVFTLAVESEVRLDHYTQAAKATDGLGRALSTGVSEVYSEMELWRTA